MTDDPQPDPAKLRIAVLEDHQTVVDGYRYRFRDSTRLEVVGAAAFGEDLEPLLAAQPVDVVFLDVDVPASPHNPNPFPILHTMTRLQQLHPEITILVISMLDERGIIRSVMEAGASAYVLKDDREGVTKLEEIVLAVTAGGIYISPHAQQLFVTSPADQMDRPLTARQLEVLSFLNAYPELSMREAASRLGIEPSTVRNTMSAIYFRLGVRNLFGALSKAQQLGLITQGPLGSA